MKKLIYILVLFSLIFSVQNCSEKKGLQGGREVTDGLGRKVRVPEKVNRIIGINAGGLRMLTYVATEKVIAVEQGEEKNGIAPYNHLNPELHKLPLIGPRFGGDAELIMKAKPDVVFTTMSAIQDVEALQQKIGVPVVVIKSPEFSMEREEWNKTLRLVAEVCQVPERAEKLIQLIDQNLSELKSRLEKLPKRENPSVYIGGISARGSHGITSTRKHYAPFVFANAFNIASTLDKNYVSKTPVELEKKEGTKGAESKKGKKKSDNPLTAALFIDQEKLLEWNPDILFIDGGGIEMIKKEIHGDKPLLKTLKAYQNQNLYMTYPLNAYSTNYEMILINAWHVAKCLHPEAFQDIDLTKKSEEILQGFFRKKLDVTPYLKYFKKVNTAELSIIK